MGDKSGISWTDATWNPIVGCSIVSPGCTNCYAMQMANRIERMQPNSHYAGTTKVVNGNPVWTGKMVMAPEHILLQPLKWKRPRSIFVNSMSDLFHESVPDEWIAEIFNVMAECKHHQFQILTKRSARMRSILTGPKSHELWNSKMWHKRDVPVLPNVHLGVSCEDQTRADERIPDLLATPAAKRFVSAEPLLGPIDFTCFRREPSDIDLTLSGQDRVKAYWNDALTGQRGVLMKNGDVLEAPNDFGPRIDQIIVGGESGPGHRPMQIEWAESIMRQCREAGTAFFFKQDSGPRSGLRGRASDELWACKQMVGDA